MGLSGFTWVILALVIIGILLLIAVIIMMTVWLDQKKQIPGWMWGLFALAIIFLLIFLVWALGLARHRGLYYSEKE